MTGGLRKPAGGRRAASAAVAAALACTLAGCSSPVAFYRPGEGAPDGPVAALPGPAPYVRARAEPPVPVAAARTDVYAATRAGMLRPAVRSVPHRLYVPDARTGRVAVVDQRAARVVGRLPVRSGRVVAGWDLRRLWSDGAVPVSPRTGRAGRAAPGAGADGTVYFDPSGRDALVPAGRRLDVHDPGTLRRRGSVRLPCTARHADFSADGTFLLAACPWAGRVVRVDPVRREVTGVLALPPGARPGDLRLAPDGAVFHVTDAARGGVWLVDGLALRAAGFVPTGPGARGPVVSRDARRLYVPDDGGVTVIDFAARRAVGRWPLPAGDAEAGGVSADGSLLWLASPGRGTVYALSTRTGETVHRVKVGGRPRAPLVYPQPGHHSLGGPGLYR
ncbi:hypothetical protein ACQEU3_12070 [Spirillospora sp. CA-253888]